MKGYWLHFDYDNTGAVIRPGDVTGTLALAGDEYKGKHCLLTIVEVQKDKSLDQLGYYYAGILPFFCRQIREAGYDYSRGQAHYKLKEWCGVNEEIIDIRTGEVTYRVRSLAEYKQEEFGQFIEKIAVLCSEFLGAALPEPTGREWTNHSV